MKKYFTIVLICLPFILFCQSSDTTRSGKLEIGISFSPDYSFRTLKPDDTSKWITDSRDSIEIPKFGYTVGAFLNYKLNKKIKIETGILFSDKGEQTKKYSLENTVSGQQPIKYSFNDHYYYIGVPVKADYYFLIGKLKFYITAGVSADIFLFQKITSIVSYANNDQKTNSTSNPGFTRLNLAVVAGCGINYPISKKINFKMEPIYRRSVTSIINAPVKSYLYSAGINIGVYKNF